MRKFWFFGSTVKATPTNGLPEDCMMRIEPPFGPKHHLFSRTQIMSKDDYRRMALAYNATLHMSESELITASINNDKDDSFQRNYFLHILQSVITATYIGDIHISQTSDTILEVNVNLTKRYPDLLPFVFQLNTEFKMINIDTPTTTKMRASRNSIAIDSFTEEYVLDMINNLSQKYL